MERIHDSVLHPESFRGIGGEAGNFRSTDWSMIRCAAGADLAAEEALAKLCQGYWYPLYAFIRRRGYDCDDAKDLTQDFFAHLLQDGFLQSADQRKGKFRSFLLTSLKNLLANDWDKKHAAKRGGNQVIISLDDTAEDRYVHEPSHNSTPEKIFEQSWALTVIRAALERLKQQYMDAGKGDFFDGIQSYLSEERVETYVDLAQRLHTTEGAIKMSVVRMRRHFGYLLRSEIARTVSDASEVEEELRHLFASLGN